jgi:hypothetical protein
LPSSVKVSQSLVPLPPLPLPDAGEMGAAAAGESSSISATDACAAGLEAGAGCDSDKAVSSIKRAKMGGGTTFW